VKFVVRVAGIATVLALWIAVAVPKLVGSPSLPPEPAPGVDENAQPWQPALTIDTFEGKTAEQWHARLISERQRYKHALHTVIFSQPYGKSWLEAAFLCIHSFEGSWNDPDAPYWGGVQMDASFMRSYGDSFYRAWGTADHWPIAAQIATAMRAYLAGRGFHPWPNTARYCGLL
jgi:hypothetical protein